MVFYHPIISYMLGHARPYFTHDLTFLLCSISISLAPIIFYSHASLFGAFWCSFFPIGYLPSLAPYADIHVLILHVITLFLYILIFGPFILTDDGPRFGRNVLYMSTRTVKFDCIWNVIWNCGKMELPKLDLKKENYMVPFFVVVLFSNFLFAC